MSITFWAPEAPTQLVRPYEDEPDYEEAVSTLPELNLSNRNASVFLSLLQIPFDDCGTIACADLPALCRRALSLLNSPQQLEDNQIASSSGRDLRGVEALGEGVTQLVFGPRIVDCGLQPAQLERYARTFAELAQKAHQQGYAVSWG